MEDAMKEGIPAPAPPRTMLGFLKRFLTVFKMAAIAILILLLLIPLSMVQSVLEERLGRRDAAVKEITSSWGSEQVIMGPFLIVPYRHTQITLKDQVINGRVERMEVSERVRSDAYFLPAVFKADGRLKSDRLHRGIYETVVYSGTLEFNGSFDKPNFDEWKVDPQQILWDEAEVAVSITDLRGAKESLQIKLAGQVFPLKPGRKLEALEGGVYAQINGLNLNAETIPFSMSLTLNGSSSLRFAPVGVNNEIRMASSWPDPSFQGAFLPTEREISPAGFKALWKISYYGRSYPQQWNEETPVDKAAITSSLFGVNLVPTLDSYRYVERSTKYGILLIALLFTTYFLFEILSGVRVHAFQYTLVGFALCLFYLLLLALSEVTSFGAAYWIGAAMASLMIALYSAKVLRSFGRAAFVAAGLLLIYGFLFVILRMQDYALLFGAAGLFLALAIVMFVTRNIDWYARDSE
jgi:inner membrane protein